MEENKDNKSNHFKKLDDQLKDVDVDGMPPSELETETNKILEELSKVDSFDEEIEQILANFNEQTMDLTKLQTQLILLIKKYAHSREHNSLLKGKNIKIDDKLIAANIIEATDILIQQRTNIVSDTKNVTKDGAKVTINKSRNDLKRIIKSFAVYEIYKVMNPRRIAGETKKDNFAHNVIERGLDVAKHYTGGSKKEIASYSPQFVKKLENKHASINKGGR